MKVDWRQVSHIAGAIVGQVVPGVAVVEQLAWQFGNLHGTQRQDAVVELVKQSLSAAEGLTSKDLANDTDIERATRTVIDAVVALHNVVARKTAATPVV
jgi:hypothetical protein